jgi:FlaA1/EpsC-like NDP-sugar epimerase
MDLAADDLLARTPRVFPPDALRPLLEGRRLLITGAAGSIGSGIARQAAAHAPESLVLADVDENGLYLLYRSLAERHPRLAVHPEVANIREPGRLAQLFRQHRPQDVLHAAAHKHVPLMELAPEEAVKNNVAGTRNVLQAAGEAGGEKLVLVSTDKAVKPASVMGLTKKLAEQVVLDGGGAGLTAGVVRFGNVLGSAGSVVPIFAAQIAAGGPVTVTDPACRRYLTTVQEAVGFLLFAGLTPLGRLCVLEMGAPVRILDLARRMITRAGRDVAIAFTGLRPGEKLEETLMTPEEKAGGRLVDGVWIVEAPATPPGMTARLPILERLAERGARAELLRELRAAAGAGPESAPHGVDDPLLIGLREARRAR